MNFNADTVYNCQLAKSGIEHLIISSFGTYQGITDEWSFFKF